MVERVGHKAIALITLNFPNAAHEILITIAAYAVISGIAAKIYARLYQKRLAQVTETPRTISG